MTTQTIHPAPGLMTAAEFCEKYDDRRYELVKGRLEELPMPSPMHGKICMRIGALIYLHAETQRLGHTMSNNSDVQVDTDPDTIRGPDISFHSYDRLPPGKVPAGLLSVSPDLAVEVRSPSNSWTALFAKVGEYLNAGVRVVVILDEETETASVYRPGTAQQTLRSDETLTVPEILPGFAMRVGTLFE
jgi:Uma2 family endonuclease